MRNNVVSIVFRHLNLAIRSNTYPNLGNATHVCLPKLLFHRLPFSSYLRYGAAPVTWKKGVKLPLEKSGVYPIELHDELFEYGQSQLVNSVLGVVHTLTARILSIFSITA